MIFIAAFQSLYLKECFIKSLKKKTKHFFKKEKYQSENLKEKQKQEGKNL